MKQFDPRSRLAWLCVWTCLAAAIGCRPLDLGGSDASAQSSCRGSSCLDAGPNLPPPPPPTDAAADTGSRADASAACSSDLDCDDHVFCNGVEHCSGDDEDGGAARRCLPADKPACVQVGMCVEALQRCDCDFDGDGLLSARCGGTDCDEDHDNHDLVSALCPGGDDCDDTDRRRFGHNAEVCDPEGVDEDCKFDTFAGPSKQDDPIGYDRLRDQDEDGVMNAACHNVDPVTGTDYRAPPEQRDCNDQNPNVAPGKPEQCDDLDNDCDQIVDEVEGSGVAFGLQTEYCFDGDRDGYGIRSRTLQACARPDQYASCRFDEANGEDCLDTNPDVHPGNKTFEVCDGLDNDCDGKIDQADKDVDPLPDQLSFPGTDLVCSAGSWTIPTCPDDLRWCNHASVSRGCETDATRLSSCRACDTQCVLSCGQKGCDELSQISAGADHTCGISDEGNVLCWGRGALGRLGDDAETNALVPTSVSGMTGATRLAAGSAHTCAVAGASNTVYCWGDNSHGQLGNADVGAFSTTPVAAVGRAAAHLEDAAQLASGDQHSCAVLSTGMLLCWGETSGGRLGDRTTSAGSGLPRYVVGELDDGMGNLTYPRINDAVQVGAGELHSCTLRKDGTVWCWGDDSYGQLGDAGAAISLDHARRVPGLEQVESISVGGNHTCALTQGQVYCWGLNDMSQLGRESDERDGTPQVVAGLQNVASIAAGDDFTCVLQADGAVSCWGDDADGELGNAAGDSTAEPQSVAISGATALSAGGHVCALSSSKQARCWGPNFYGQLGNGSATLDPTPSPQAVRASKDSVL
jgi:alpha-tubulin suppressor-like RCC1 family protein